MKTRFIKTMLFGFLVSLFCLSSVTHAFIEPEAAQNTKAKAKNSSKAGEAKSNGDKEKDHKQPEYAKNRLIVKYKKNTGNRLADTRKFNERKSKLKADGEHRRLKRLGKAKRTEVLQVPEGSDIQELAGLYSSDPNVEYAEPDFMMSALMEPNDTAFPQLWGMKNTGQVQNLTSYGVPDADINATEAWDITTGDENVVVAIIDTGISYTHPELADNIWVNPGEVADNGIDDDNNGYIDDIHGINTLYDHGDPMDDQGHGTHVAGTIGARGNNALGVAGVNWNVKMIGCKFLDKGPGHGYLSDAIECMDYLLELKTRAENPVDIVATNNSWGGYGYSQALSDAILAHQQAGIMTVAAAGNQNFSIDTVPFIPAGLTHSSIISVAASNWKDNRASFSNYGRKSVDVAAPGENILSTVPIQASDSECRLCALEGYKYASGTSMSAPHVTGLVALLKAQDPSRDLNQLRNLVMTSGTPLPQWQDFTVSGRRIRAADVNGTGALTCDNQHLQRKITPNAESIGITSNSRINFQILSINCDSPGEEPEISVSPTNQNIVLKDDGLGGDAMSGDSIFSAAYLPNFGETFTFPDGTEMTTAPVGGYKSPIVSNSLYVLPNSSTAPIYNGYSRQISEPAHIRTPFPISFGGVSPGYTQMYVNSNGTISFDGPASGDNQTLPHPSLQNLIAPLWDNYTSADAHRGIYDWGVAATLTGDAPHRHFTVHFSPLAHSDLVSLYSAAPDTASFEVIFFEDSADIVFNYIDTQLGAGNIYSAAHSFGASATIGIQTAPDIYKHFSVNTQSVVSNYQPMYGGGKSLRWQFVGIEADAGKDTTVASGEQAWLDGSESSGMGGVTQYQWTQVSGTPVTLNNANTKRASFVAPARDTLEFELIITDATGATASDRVIIKTSARPVANAGSDQFPVLDTGSMELSINVNLNGLGSVDTDGQIVRYQWTILDEPQITLPNPNSAQTSLEISWGKTLRIQLTVTDDAGLQSSDIVVINPNARPLSQPWIRTNPLTVYTGQTYTLEGAAYDHDGYVVSYLWQQVSGPTVQITNANSTRATFVAPASATQLSFKLVSTDNDGATSSDQMVCIEYSCFPSNHVTIKVITSP